MAFTQLKMPDTHAVLTRRTLSVKGKEITTHIIARDLRTNVQVSVPVFAQRPEYLDAMRMVTLRMLCIHVMEHWLIRSN